MKQLKPLNKGDKIHIEKVGTLFLDPERNVQFVAEEQNDFLLESFGLGGFRVQPIKREGAQERIEKKIEKVKIGDPVEISVDAYPNKTFYGKVFTIKSAAASQFSVIPQNNATGNYTKVAQRIPIKITLDSASSDNQLYLFPGMNVEVKIKVQGS